MGLKQLRQRAGLTQAKLAKMTGIARTTLSGYECGVYDVHQMTLDNALRLSRALGCHPSDLTDGYPD
ncbi:helix-turn-helix domain-containing protein [Bifidobacterium platyrrhinorum]|uniref:helix-turn-helix domain-containing protein n=1 Tax=Bifidobacterium platyrrhinorum TaxID=2661628 RepID=UPI0013D8007A